MGSSAGVQVEISDIDQSDLAFARRQLAHAHTLCFHTRCIPDGYGTIFCDHLVGKPLDAHELLVANRLTLQINTRAFFSQMKGYRRIVEEMDECCREHVLT